MDTLPSIQILGLEISEPATMITDYMISALSIYFGAKLVFLWKENRRGYSLHWAAAFFSIAAATLLGGTYHGFALIWPEGVISALWKAATYVTGIGSFFIVWGVVSYRFGAKTVKIVLALLAIKLLAYLIFISLWDDFLFVVFDYGSSLLIIGLIELVNFVRTQEQSSKWILAGVLISIAAALVQQSGLRIHAYFNHNDIYHLIQMLSLYCFFMGIIRQTRKQFSNAAN